MKRVIASLAFLLLLSVESNVYACSCAGPVSPCQAYANARAVFVGYIEEISPENYEESEYTEQKAYVIVERAFKGVREGAKIFLHQPNHNCAPKFKPKRRYLLYADYHTKEKTWEIFGCGRSTSVEYAGDDLLYLQRLPESAAKTRISGDLTHHEGYTRIKSLAGIKVKIVGETMTSEVYTDANGVYEIYGLPPGKYTVDPEIPFGLEIRFPMPFGPIDYADKKSLKIELKPNSCAGVDFILSSKMSITGKVYGATGEVLPSVCLDLVPLDEPIDAHFREYDCTEKDGSYELKRIPPGRYVIVINKEGIVSGHYPFSTTYYPGVFEKERASIITIGVGDRLENYDIRIPSQVPTNTVQGVLLYMDGRPVAREYIRFKADGIGSQDGQTVSTVTDDQGRFSFRVLRGASGWLQGALSAYRGKYIDCPQIDKELEKRPGGFIDIEATPIRLIIDIDLKDLKVIFPFASCELQRNK